MRNSELLLSQCDNSKVVGVSKKFVNKVKLANLVTLDEFHKFTKKIKISANEIEIELVDAVFIDGLVQMYFETLILSLLNDRKKIYIRIRETQKSEHNLLRKMFFESSPIIRVLTNDISIPVKINKRYQLKLKQYKKMFMDNEFENKTYLRIFLDTEHLDDKKKLGDLYDNIECAINRLLEDNNYTTEENEVRSIKRIISEFIGNVHEHLHECECILMIHLNRVPLNEQEHILSLNLSFLNLSENLIYDDTNVLLEKMIIEYNENKFENIKKENIKKRYIGLVEYYNKQKILFNELYKREHFLIYCAFQYNITTRAMSYGINGGTGLANTLLYLRKFSYSKDLTCYVYAGNFACFFDTAHLLENGNINYFNSDFDPVKKPEHVRELELFMPGLGFNWNFPIKYK